MDRGSRPVRAAIVVADTTGALASSRRTQKLLIAVAVVIGVLAAPVAASAFSSAVQAREALIRAQLNPRPLYPDVLPHPLSSNNSAAFTHGHFFAWKGSPNTNPAWFSINYRCRCNGRRSYLVNATFSRGPVSDIAKAINLSQNVQRHMVGHVRIHGKRLYRFETNMWFGYMWKQQGFAYSMFARYSARVGWGFVRHFVESLYPLGRLWSGRTSQGQGVSLYLSRGGLNWTLFSTWHCADGSFFPTWDADLWYVKHNGSFADSYSNTWTAAYGMLQRETLSMRGKLPASAGAPVTGSFDVHNVSVDHPRDPQWNCGAKVTWQASPVK